RDSERRRDQANEQIEKFYEIFKDMSFEISFTDALILMPKFASTLKALIGNKEKLSEMSRTPMNEHCSTVIQNKLPRKLGDPGKFLIPCEFPGMDECLALADLGASINLMPLYVWEELSLLELTPTCMTLELADRSVSKPIGIAKDVSFKVGVLHFPADFVVIDFEPDPQVPLILERCFLKTGRALIDVHKVVSTMSPTLTPFGDSDFLLFEEVDAFLGVEDDPDSPKINPFYYEPEGDILLLESILNSEPFPPLPDHEQYLPSFKKELKMCEAKTVKSSVDEPPKVELKDLPPHLEYAFLEGDNKLPVIIAKELGDEDKSALIKDYKPAVQHQRRVNPKIHDVIKKEVEKLLDAGLIYLISDSLWVSPVHCIPKKGGFTIIENKENELIPTRLVTGWRSREPSSRPSVLIRKPYENMLDPKGINETFPLETLSMVTFRGDSSASWFADFANYHAGIDFMGPFPSSRGNKYILVTVDYLSKWVEAKALPTNDARVVCKFLKSLFTRFGSPRVIISDRGTHFCNDQFAKVMLKYGVTHRLSTAYHPQTGGQVEGAMISGGQFVARLAEYFGLLNEERLQGLTVIVRDLLVIDMGELKSQVAVASAPKDAEDAHVINEGAQAVPAPVQAPHPPPPVVRPARTMAQRLDRLEEDVHGLRGALGEQREVLDNVARDFSRFTTWMVIGLS
nr:reverse transcriptase domain-containing protein [Tanacetum cinerariifolium]